MLTENVVCHKMVLKTNRRPSAFLQNLPLIIIIPFPNCHYTNSSLYYTSLLVMLSDR
jgi:hypothetical protein